MFKIKNILNCFKENKKLFYAVNIFILLVILSMVLKLDASKYTHNDNSIAIKNSGVESELDNNYVGNMEKKIEEMISMIEGINNVKVMIYTKSTESLEPVYDENTSIETNFETSGDGTKSEEKRDTIQKKVVVGSDDKAVEKYYKYPDISGVLIVVNYTGNRNIKSILLDSVKTLFNININDIEIVLSNG